MRTLVVAAALAACSASTSAADQCFASRDYQGFKPVDAHAFIMRALPNAYFRIGVESGCPELLRPGAALVTVVRGSDRICGPLDWDLRVGQLGPGGIAVGCVVSSQRRLTAAEVAALPPERKP